MEIRRFGKASVLHLEPETYAHLLRLAETGPGRPGGVDYDLDDPWHALIVEPFTHGCWVYTGILDDGPTDGLPASLIGMLQKARDSDATYVLFDVDVPPMLDFPVFEYPEPPISSGSSDIMV